MSSTGDISRIVFVSRGSFERFGICYPAHIEGVLCKGYSLGVSARLGSNSTIALRVEAEGHNNWLRTSAYCVWESQASPR